MGDIIQKWRPDAVNVDSGQGGGIIDLLRSNNFRINEIIAGASSPDPRLLNLRTYMWQKMRDWLPSASIPTDKLLRSGLIAPQYRYTTKGKMVLESKDDIKKRMGKVMLDGADALALTFATPVKSNARRAKPKTEWNILG